MHIHGNVKYRRTQLNMEQLYESQKTQKIIFINTSKKLTELQKPKHRRLLNEISNPYSSIEVTFIVSWAPVTNLKIEPNSVIKIWNQSQIISVNPNNFEVAHLP